MSGDLDTQLVGREDTWITQFEMATTAEELQKQLEEEHENSKRLMEDAEIMKIRNELETEKLKQKQWETAIEQLKQTREHAEQEHARAITEIKEKAEAAKSEVSTTVLDWFKTQVADLSLPNTDTEQEKARKEKNKHDRRTHESTRRNS